MLLETPNNFPDFELLDTGSGFRLEKWGEAILARPDPQIIWPKSLPETEWDKAWAIYKTPSDEAKGRWDIKKLIPDPWTIKYQNVQFLLKLSPFKHTGLFAEQAAQWQWMLDKLKVKSEKFKVLNLFAYTGAATMILAKSGCQVTHVDSSKPAITWANENYRLNFIDQQQPFDYAHPSTAVRDDLERSRTGQGERSFKGNVRWILDDAVKFVKRELKRGAKYNGIIMDPPAFGHGPTGKTWKFNQDLPGLLNDCVQLLSDDARFLIINGYATNSSALSLNNLLEDAIKNRGGKIEFGELCLQQKNQRMISTGIFARWSNE